MSKEQHGFSVSVAIEVGVHCALLLQHLVFIQKATVKNGEDWRRNWVKRSAKSLQETYPYMTPKEIRGATERLERDGNIVSRIDNEMPGDRTKAFCCTKKGLDLMGIPFDKRANGVTKGQMPFDKRANDHLTKGQMLIKEGYNSFNLLVEEEKALPPAENSTSTLKEKTKPQINSAPPPSTFIELRDPETPGATIYDAVPTVEPPPNRINLYDRPNAKTPAELQDALSRFYVEFENEWSAGVLENSKGRRYPKERRTEIVRAFCCHAIKSNRGGDTFQMLNADLQAWFLRQPEFERTQPATNNKTAAVYEPPRNAVY